MRTASPGSVRPLPLGIPPIYLIDQLQRGRSATQVLHAAPSVLHEYHGAQGYAFPWGQLIEERILSELSWRVMPVALWQKLAPARAGSPLQIADLTGALHAQVRAVLQHRLPTGIALTGCQAGRRLSPHSLFTLVCLAPAWEDAAQAWVHRQLLPELLGDVLAHCERHLVTLFETIHRGGTGARPMSPARPERSPV